jgi:hypothetical protein
LEGHGHGKCGMVDRGEGGMWRMDGAFGLGFGVRRGIAGGFMLSNPDAGGQNVVTVASWWGAMAADVSGAV